MKRTIKGTLCDTSTAEQIGESRYDGCTEYLYRTKSGKYFIHTVRNKGLVREDIYLMTNTAAADWIMVAYGPVDAYYDAKTGAKKEWAKISVSSTTKALIDEPSPDGCYVVLLLYHVVIDLSRFCAKLRRRKP